MEPKKGALISENLSKVHKTAPSTAELGLAAGVVHRPAISVIEYLRLIG